MEKVFTEFSFYHQIMLWDVEDRNSIAQWFSGEEMIVFGLKGVNVGVLNDATIEITVRREEGVGNATREMKAHYQCLASGVVHYWY